MQFILSIINGNLLTSKKFIMTQKQIDQLTVNDRLASPTPKFFKKLRNVGLVLAAVSASLLAAPVTLPAIVITVASYIAVAGTVVTAVSQVTVEAED